MTKPMLIAVAAVLFVGSASAQTQFIIADRTNDALFRARDLNGNGTMENAEITLFFNATNVAGTHAPLNPTAQAISKCRIVIVGDQQSFDVLRLEDLNNDGDALDAGESKVFVGPGNSAGLSFAFPTGCAFDNQCRAYVVNAGNASGPDAIYRLVDLNGDGDAMDNVGGVNEASYYVADGAFGPGNGPYGPQEMFFDANNVGYVRNSSTGNFQIFRFEDLNNNDRADDAGEFTLFLDSTNLSGVAIVAGFALEPDRVRMSQHTAMYTLQTASGGVDQLVRAVDLNDDKDAQDAGEAAIVWSNAAAGFTGVDVVSLIDGDVLVTDNSGNTVVRLHDANADGDFLDSGEQTVYLPNSAGPLAAVRQMDRLCRLGDTNCDGTVNVSDLLSIINAWGGGSCIAADINCDGTVNVSDLLAVINNWG